MAARLLVALHEVADQDETAHGFILRHRLHVAACISPHIIGNGITIRHSFPFKLQAGYGARRKCQNTLSLTPAVYECTSPPQQLVYKCR